MVVRQYYTQQGGALVNYTFTELIDGTGILQLNGFSHNSGGAESYSLSSNTPYSNVISSSGAISVGNPFEVDFDTPVLNLPRNMKGTAFVQVPWRVRNDTSTNQNYVQVSIRHLSGATETNIVTVSGALMDSGSGGTSRVALLKLPINTVQHFKPGEQIRVTVGVDAGNAGNSPKAHIGHDPKDRDGNDFPSSDTTQLIAWLPFKTDV